jgi:aromatic-L-amino-acid decarboxylase
MAGNPIAPQKIAASEDLTLSMDNVVPWHPARRLSTPAPALPTHLDPTDWRLFSLDAHAALDRMIQHLRTIRTRPVWTEAPAQIRAQFNSELPRRSRAIGDVLDDFEQFIQPYATGNLHPAFMGWVHGAGTPAGMIADMLAAGLNMNCGGRNHIGIEIENQITRWMQQVFEFPDTASGIFLTGTSMANFLGLVIARNVALDNARTEGIAGATKLCAYASKGVHGCISRAMELSGIGSDSLRLVACDENGAMRVEELERLIAEDKARGYKPFLVVGTAGSVDVGAIDPLRQIADIAAAKGIWFHVDGAFGALAALSPELRPLISGIERADSIGFDFHKWAHVPYDAGFLLVRDGETHRRSFEAANAYLSRAESGLAAGDVWPCDLGPDLSRGCRALKVWFTLQHFGADALGNCILENCRAAKHLEGRLREGEKFSLAAPVKLNIVCFSVNGSESDSDNRRIVEALHVSGRAAPSITLLNGKAVIRCAIVNHRTTTTDIDKFVADLHDVVNELGLSTAA